MKKLILLLALLGFGLLAACGGNDDTTAAGEGETAGDEDEAAEGEADGGEGEAAGDAQILRISLGLNDQHPLYHSAVHFGELLAEKTDDFKVEVYHSAQIGDDRVATEMLQMGDLEITIPSTSPLVNFLPEFGVFDLPFMIPNEEVADAVLDGPFGDKMLELLDSQDLVGLAWYENGFRNLTNSENQIYSTADLNGMVVRTMENSIHLDAWEALGANPTPMSFAELFTAMQQGTVDGQENPFTTINLEGFHEVQDYLTGTNHVYTPFVFLFSKPIWEELTEEQQGYISEAAMEARLFNREENRKASDEALESLKEVMDYNAIEGEVFEEFQDAIQDVITKHSANIGEDIVDEFIEAIEAAQ